MLATVERDDQAGGDLLIRYLAHRDDLAARDKLVESCFPWVRSFAESVARRMRLSDPENCAGEALLHFVAVVLPKYDPRRGNFQVWCRGLVVRRLCDLSRRARRHVPTVNEASLPAPLDSIPVMPPPERPGIDGRRLGRGLTRRQAAVLRLRFLHYLAVREIARRLGISKSTVRLRLTEGIDRARQVWPDDEGLVKR